ncbi:hypothetical protein ACFV4Q_26080 [Streptomyces nojiriensis]|uniref:hypothetical protein n=1 Tax=Streptomyces nojiriensis TaxID=66374 RepID=UPI003656FAF4
MNFDEADFAASAPAAARASAFAGAIWADRDMRAAWAYTDPLLRKCWVQAWLHPLRAQAVADGYRSGAVVESLMSDKPSHPLWDPFARTQIRQMTASFAVDMDTWGFGSAFDPVAQDMALLKFLPVPKSGAIEVGELHASVPFLMRFTLGAGWRVLNFVSDRVPEPGWPPAL